MVRRMRLASIALAGAVVLLAGGGGTGSGEAGPAGAGRAPAACDVPRIGATIDTVTGYRTLADWLPNTSLKVAGSPARPMSDVAVLGRVVGAGRTGRDVVAVRLAVERVVAGADPGREVEIALDDGLEPARLAGGMRCLGRIVVLAQHVEPRLRAKFGTWHATYEGALVARVGRDGHLDLPMIESPGFAAGVLHGTPTLAALERAAARPPRVVRVP